MRTIGRLGVAILATATLLQAPFALAGQERAGTSWCSAVAYVLGDGSGRTVTVTASCSAAVRELRVSIPSARRLRSATVRTASLRRTPCRIERSTTAVCGRVGAKAVAGVAIAAAQAAPAKTGRTVVFQATFVNGARSSLRLTTTGPPGDDG